MKELLQERLKNLQVAVEQKKAQAQQANADMNVLIGHVQECSNTIALVEAKEREDAAKSQLPDPNAQKCADADHVHCEVEENCEVDHVHCEVE